MGVQVVFKRPALTNNLETTLNVMHDCINAVDDVNTLIQLNVYEKIFTYCVYLVAGYSTYILLTTDNIIFKVYISTHETKLLLIHEHVELSSQRWKFHTIIIINL